MNINALLQTIIYIISSSLFLPVMLFLVILMAYILYVSGTLLSEWIERRRVKKIKDLNIILDEIKTKKFISEDYFLYFPANVKSYFQNLNNIVFHTSNLLEIKVENLLQEYELKFLKEYNKLKMLIRIGPSLGLMGTLIPMGTGLASMSSGDITKLSSSLVVAFTTTVVGLALGVISYFYSTLKEAWIKEDLKNIEIITETLMQSLKK